MIGNIITLRILMIGNSFSVCVGKDLPYIAQSVPGHQVVLTSAYIGGCSLERHWNNVVESEENPDAKQYAVHSWANTAQGVAQVDARGSINDLLKNGQWDIVTIQQASHFSWKPETYTPYAGQLVEYIRKHQPNAKIWIQQTWAYRADDGRIRPEGEWGIDQAEMHKCLSKAYRQLSESIDAPVIPTGRAVRYSRERTPEANRFAIPTPEQKAACRWPDLPSQASDVVGRTFWSKNKTSQELEIGADTIHLNRRGEYLQSCTWFEALFGTALPENTYVPGDIGKSDAAFLRACAHDAVAGGTKILPEDCGE